MRIALALAAVGLALTAVPADASTQHKTVTTFSANPAHAHAITLKVQVRVEDGDHYSPAQSVGVQLQIKKHGRWQDLFDPLYTNSNGHAQKAVRCAYPGTVRAFTLADKYDAHSVSKPIKVC